MSAHAAAPAAAPKAAKKSAPLKTRLIVGLIIVGVAGLGLTLVDWGSLSIHNPFASGSSTPVPPPAPIAAPTPALPPVRITAQGHKAMCDMLDPVQDARQRALAKCP